MVKGWRGGSECRRGSLAVFVDEMVMRAPVDLGYTGVLRTSSSGDPHEAAFIRFLQRPYQRGRKPRHLARPAKAFLIQFFGTRPRKSTTTAGDAELQRPGWHRRH